VRLDGRRQAIQDQWMLQISGSGAKLIGQVPGVEQTFNGVFAPGKPPPGRTFPPCVKRKLPWQGKAHIVRNGKVTNEYVR
jgi:branched-chain amino acid transport system substrate-binding protein